MRQGVRWRHVLAVFAVVLTLGYVALQEFVRRGGFLLQTSWVTAGVLVVMAVVLLAFAWQVRRYLATEAADRKPGQEVSPQRARNTLVAAQASALAGAVFTAWYAAHALVVSANADIPTQREQLWRYLAALVAALALTGAGLLAQRWCRLDPPDAADSASEASA